MEIWHWILDHGSEALGNIGIVVSLTFAAASWRAEAKTRRDSNLLTLTENLRELLKPLYEHEDVSRVQQPNVDLNSQPMTPAEIAYTKARIQHLFSAYRVIQDDLTTKPEGLASDIRAFFSLPIPKAVWENIKRFQNRDFVTFVDSCLE